MASLLVTGASGGIGSAIANVAPPFECLLHSSTAKPGFVACNFASDDDVVQFANEVGGVGSISKIVFSHGVYLSEADQKPGTNQRNLIFQINAYSIHSFLSSFLPLASGPVQICLVSSIVADQGSLTGFAPTYAASKAAALNFLKSLSKKHSTHEFFAVAPGPTETEMTNGRKYQPKDLLDPAEVASVVWSAFDERLRNTTRTISKENWKVSHDCLPW